MNRNLKWILLGAAIAVVAGLAISAVAAWRMGLPVLLIQHRQSVTEESVTAVENGRGESGGTSAETGLTERTVTFGADCGEIVTDLKLVDLEIRAADRKDIQVRWWETGDDDYRVWEDRGVLWAEYGTDSNWLDHIWFGISWESRRYQMEIEVPLDYEGVLTLDSTSGNISAGGLSFGPDSAAASTSGEIRLENCSSAGDLSVDATSGGIDLKNLSCGGSLIVSATSGDIELESVGVLDALQISRTSGGLSAEDVDCGGAVDIGGTSGDNELKRLSAVSLRVDSSSGEAEGRDLDIEQAVEIQTTSGEVSLTLSGSIEDYDISVDTSSGDSNLPSRGDYGRKILEITTTSGDIDVEFSGR